MNWHKLEEKFPLSAPEIREHAESTNTTGQTCLYTFLDSKGYPDNFLRIRQLIDYEEKLKALNLNK